VIRTQKAKTEPSAGVGTRPKEIKQTALLSQLKKEKNHGRK
jgi:hypothetical protein